MNVCDDIRNKLLNDLQTGIDYVRNGEKKYISYQDILKSYCVNTVPRNLFLSKYKSLPQIETLNAEEKREWKKFVNEIFPNTSPQFRLEAVKIIYTVSVLSEK